MKTLPENIVKLSDKNEIVSNKTADIVSRVIAKFKIEKVDEEFIQKSAEDVTKDFFLIAFNAEEGKTPTVPQGYERYEDAFSKIVAIVEAHKRAEASVKEKKTLEDDAKKKQREEAKKAREEEDKFFVNQDIKFQETLVVNLAKVKDTATTAISALQKSIKLPKSISFTKEGQGLVFGDNVTSEDIAAATSGIIAGFEGQSAAEGLLQFAIGDLINKAVESRTYRSKADAQGAIALVVNEKAKRSYTAGSLAQYATMAERIPHGDRKPGVSPSLYLLASKAVVPRDKNIKGEELEKLTKEFEGERASLIEEINEGKLTTVKQVQEATKKVVEKLGIEKKDSPAEAKKAKEGAMRDFFFWFFIRQEVLNKETNVAIVKLSDGNLLQIGKEEVMTKLSEAYASAQRLNVDNLESVLSGKKSVTGKDGKAKDEAFYMPYPFELPKKEEPKAPEATEGAAAAEPEAEAEAEVAAEAPVEEAGAEATTGDDEDIDI
jgi:hypothetical protein